MLLYAFYNMPSSITLTACRHAAPPREAALLYCLDSAALQWVSIAPNPIHCLQGCRMMTCSCRWSPAELERACKQETQMLSGVVCM